MLTLGFLRGELATLLWGGAFGFLWTYVFAARTLVAWTIGRSPPQGTLAPVPGIGLVFRPHPRPAAPAFFSWWLRVDGVHSPQRRFNREVPLTDETTVDLSLPRGRYQVIAGWELRDAFGLTRLVPPARWEAEVVVKPEGRPFVPPSPPSRPGRWTPRKAGRRAGDPFDVRAYVPGDDLRRLHWPLFAHAGTLFVRTAELSPPPWGHQFIVLDTDVLTEDDLDVRLEALSTWLETLDGQQTPWTVAIPSVRVTWGPGQASGTILAGLSPHATSAGPFPASWPQQVTVLTGANTGPGSLTHRLAATRRRVQPVEVLAPVPLASGRKSWWRR